LFGQEFAESVVGGAVDRRGGEPHQDSSIAVAGKGGSPGAWDDVNVDLDAAGRAADHPSLASGSE
jgi:hypothetical protein